MPARRIVFLHAGDVGVLRNAAGMGGLCRNIKLLCIGGA